MAIKSFPTAIPSGPEQFVRCEENHPHRREKNPAFSNHAEASDHADAPRELVASSELDPSEKRQVRKFLFLILLSGMLVRVGLWVWFADLPIRIVDETDYNRLAVNLVEHGEFAFDPGTPTSLRPPLYPFLVAGVYSLFGLENYQAVRFLQIIFSLVSVWLVYGLGRAVYSWRVGLLGAALMAFYPTLLGFNNLLLTECLFTLLLTATCLAVVQFIRTERLGVLALAGVLLGLTALTRSVVWMAPPFLAAFVILSMRSAIWRRFLAAGLFLAGFTATILPWTIRNTSLQETFVTIDVMGGRNLLMGNYQHTPMYRSWDAISLRGDKAWYQELFATCPPEERHTQGILDKVALRHALKFIRENPWLTVRRDVIKFFDFWGLERELIAGGSKGYFGDIPGTAQLGLAVLIGCFYVLSLFLGIFGAFMVTPADRRVHLFLVLVIAFICGMHTLVFGHSRYHVPLMPLIFLYAAAVLLRPKLLWAPRANWRFVTAGLVCAILAVGWVWNAFAGDWARFQEAFRNLV